MSEPPPYQERPRTESGAAAEDAVACPLCGGAAERGCVYGRDGNSLQWFAGPPGWKKNVASFLAPGLSISRQDGFTGPYVEGVRCERCRRIVLAY